METKTLLICSFITLVGIFLCNKNKSGYGVLDDFADDVIEMQWTKSFSLRLFHFLSYNVGKLFVLFWAGYSIFVKHWWYILVFFCVALVASLIASIVSDCMRPFCKMKKSIYSNIVVERKVGSIFILLGIILFFILLHYAN